MTAKRAILVASYKGGVGKTIWARAYLDAMRTLGYRVAAYDGDGQVGQMIQHEGIRDRDGRIDMNQRAIDGCQAFDVRDEEARDTLLDATQTGADVLLFDLPGGTVNEIGRVFDEDDPSALLSEYKRHGYDPTIVVVLSPMIASIRPVKDVVEQFSHLADVVAVKNEAFASADEFELFDGTTDAQGNPRGGKARAALEQNGGIVLTLPKLRLAELSHIDARSLTFAQAADDPTFKLSERTRISRWRRAVVDEVQKAGAVLGVKADPARAGGSAGSAHAGLSGDPAGEV